MRKQIKTSTLVAVAGLLTVLGSFYPSSSLAGELADTQRVARLAHAHELLGNHYMHSVVRSGESVDQVNQMIYQWTRDALPAAYKKDYKKIAQAIVDQSLKYEFDPIFLMAVIMNESSFRPTMVGGVGEIGLMQVRPTTAQWIAHKAKIHFKNKSSLKDPITNIKIGTAYLSYLREKFDSHARLYIAAYNMGQGNVEDALDHHVWPKEYAIRVMNHYISYYKVIREQNLEKIVSAKRAIAEVGTVAAE